MPIPNSGKRKVPIVIKPEKTPLPPPEPTAFETKMSEVTEKKSSGPYEYYYPKEKVAPGPQVGVPRKSRKKTFAFGAIVAILIGVFVVVMMTVFASATIVINPKSQAAQVDLKITGEAGKTTEETVRYEVIKLSETKTVTVPATGEEAVELKASGKIVVYNNFSSEPQRLIVRTRFETPDGLVFRIPESIVVPGKTVKGGVETPGSIEVEVFADEAGEKYNVEKTDFTIPGFKNDPSRFKNFYARSSTDMAGGFIGKRKTVQPADRQTALQSVDMELESSLAKNLQAKVPEGLVLLSGAIEYKSKELPQKEEASAVVLKKEMTAYAVMLNRQDLSDKITSEYIAKSAEWEGIEPTVKDYSTLKVIDLPADIETGSKLELQISGAIKVLADINTDIISQRLLGAPKGNVARLMDEFAGISSITATIRPIWKQSFPQNPSKIYVETSQ